MCAWMTSRATRVLTEKFEAVVRRRIDAHSSDRRLIDIRARENTLRLRRFAVEYNVMVPTQECVARAHEVAAANVRRLVVFEGRYWWLSKRSFN